jgi:hypothetical protein
MIAGRPFRCERCDFRFFRWSLNSKAQRVPADVADGNNALILVAPLE